MELISIVDPGHRIDTPGKSGNGVKEYEFNESVARLLAEDLSKYGKVYFTIESELHPHSEMNKSGRSKNLAYRTTNANNVYWNSVKKYGKGNFKIVFISIHANAFSNPSASGYEIFVYKHGGEAHQLAKCIHKSAHDILGVGKDIKDRGVKEANFAVLRNTIMPAVLIEHEFYTNPSAAKKLLDPKFRQLCADHILHGILSYTNIKPQITESGGDKVYRIRKSWDNPKSQIGSFTNLDNAIRKVKQNPGYRIFDDNGKQIYPAIADKEHWGKKYHDMLVGAGVDITDERYDDNITRAELFKLLCYSMKLNPTDKPKPIKVDKPSIPDNSYSVMRMFDSDVHVFNTNADNFVDVELGKRHKLEKLSSIVQDKIDGGHDVLGAINCGFFNWSAKPEHLGMLVDEGLYYTPPTNNFIDMIYHKNGNIEITNMYGYDKSALSKLQRDAHWAIGTSYSLVQNGRINLENSGKFDHAMTRQPRTLFGYRDDGSFVLVVVDGRSKKSLGVTAGQSAEIMLKLGCQGAVNFDGGGSSTMVLVEDNEPIVVNKPCDITGERSIGSCMIVYRKGLEVIK